jgi:hypothetical protein
VFFGSICAVSIVFGVFVIKGKGDDDSTDDYDFESDQEDS